MDCYVSWVVKHPALDCLVEYEEASAYAEENGLLFMETSAKERITLTKPLLFHLIFVFVFLDKKETARR
jgi:hypothetical protein